MGCIHTCQGLEVDYIGVIFGPDLIVRDNVIQTRYRERATVDRRKSLAGIEGLMKKILKKLKNCQMKSSRILTEHL